MDEQKTTVHSETKDIKDKQGDSRITHLKDIVQGL